MTERSIFAGDDHVENNPVFECTLVDTSSGTIQPFNMAGSTILGTFKTNVTSLGADPTDASAALKCSIVFDESGNVVSSQGFMLPTNLTAAAGQLWLIADSSITEDLPLGTPLNLGLKVIDALGRKKQISSLWTLKTKQGLTNRNTGA